MKKLAEVKATISGIIEDIAVSIGQEVKVADDIVVIETMKMDIPVATPYKGTIKSIEVEVGQRVENGDIIAILDITGLESDSEGYVKNNQNDISENNIESERMKAGQGDSNAQYNLGKKYYEEENYKEAVIWLELELKRKTRTLNIF